MKVFEMLNHIKKELAQVGILDNAESEWLLALALNVKRNTLRTLTELSESQVENVKKALEKRKKHIPLSYIFEEADFYGFKFKVNENVLIPRPETEELVELILKNAEDNMSILDIGTGSGAIAITLAKKTQAKVTAVDISKEALKIASENAKSNGANVEFIHSDLFQNLKGRKFDIIVSNPPYISEEEYSQLMPEVKNFEPKLALVCGEDGYAIYRKIIEKAPLFLNKNGKIYFEIGYKQADKIAEMLEKKFKDIVVKKDLQGLDRMVYATIKE